MSSDREGLTMEQWRKLAYEDHIVPIVSSMWVTQKEYMDVRKVYELRLAPGDAFTKFRRASDSGEVFAVEDYFKVPRHTEVHMFALVDPTKEGIGDSERGIHVLWGAIACWKYVAVFHNKTGELLDFVDVPKEKKDIWFKLP